MHKNRSAPCPFSETRMDERARCRPLWRKGDATELWVTFFDRSLPSEQHTQPSQQAQSIQVGSLRDLFDSVAHVLAF